MYETPIATVPFHHLSIGAPPWKTALLPFCFSASPRYGFRLLVASLVNYYVFLASGETHFHADFCIGGGAELFISVGFYLTQLAQPVEK